jgi:yeast amino acid transporter
MAVAADKPYELTDDSSNAAGYSFDEKLPNAPSLFRRFLDSFKPDSNARIAPNATHDSGAKVYDVEAAAAATAQSPLHRRLKGRHLQMIAIGGSIGTPLIRLVQLVPINRPTGTGLFVGSGQALARGGPGSVLIAFSIVGAMLFCTVQALGELATLYPVAGSFSAYATRFLCPSWGYAMGWK